MTKPRNDDSCASSDLVVIARSAAGQIVTRITSRHDLEGATQTARSILTLKPDAVSAEVHANEGPTSQYRKPPLAAIRKYEPLVVKEAVS